MLKLFIFNYFAKFRSFTKFLKFVKPKLKSQFFYRVYNKVTIYRQHIRPKTIVAKELFRGLIMLQKNPDPKSGFYTYFWGCIDESEIGSCLKKNMPSDVI